MSPARPVCTVPFSSARPRVSTSRPSWLRASSQSAARVTSARCSRRRRSCSPPAGPAALLLHLRQDVFCRQEQALDVDPEHAIPILLADLDRSTQGCDIDVVVQHVDPVVALERGQPSPEPLSKAEASATKGLAIPPLLAMISHVSSAASFRRSTARTLAPSRAKSAAVAFPFPQPGLWGPAPVTIATFPKDVPCLKGSLVLMLLRAPWSEMLCPSYRCELPDRACISVDYRKPVESQGTAATIVRPMIKASK